MKTYEILPTDKNLVQTLIDDTIGRDSDVFRFVNILNSIDCSYSVALDGRWGSGKTFFVKQAKLVLDANNEHLAVMDADVRKKFLHHARNLYLRTASCSRRYVYTMMRGKMIMTKIPYCL